MKRHIGIALFLALFAGFLSVAFREGSVSCGTFEYLLGEDISKTTFWIGNQQVTPEQLELSIVQDLLKDTYDPALAAHYGLSGSAPSASTPTSNAAAQSNKTVTPKEKVTVWFTDMFGEIIGSSQITKGTDIASSQFPQAVEDIEFEGTTYTFDSWDYDGRLIEYEYIVRANYVKK